MGTWKLEVFRMTVYMAFPVGVFWVFNQPQFFEGWMMEKRAILFPPTNPEKREFIEKTIAREEKLRQLKLEKELGLDKDN